MGCFLHCSIKNRARAFLEGHRDRDRQDSLQAGADSDSCNRQVLHRPETEDRERNRKLKRGLSLD